MREQGLWSAKPAGCKNRHERGGKRPRGRPGEGALGSRATLVPEVPLGPGSGSPQVAQVSALITTY